MTSDTRMPDSLEGSRGIARLGAARQTPRSTAAGGPTPLEAEEIRDVFNLFDKAGRGAIDPKQVRLQMGALGFQADNATIYQLMSDLDSDGSQMLEFDELAGLMRDTLKVHSEDYASRSNLSQLFEFLDDLDPRNRSGQIDLADLRRLANVLGDTISDGELKVMLAGADLEGKGYVSCEDFYQLMVNAARKMDDSDGGAVSDEDDAISVGGDSEFGHVLSDFSPSPPPLFERPDRSSRNAAPSGTHSMELARQGRRKSMSKARSKIRAIHALETRTGGQHSPPALLSRSPESGTMSPLAI